MKLLLHSCCADCVLKFAESIRKSQLKVDEIVAYFYNPNIHPRSEYLSRLKAIQKITEENKIKLIVPDWSPKEYFEKIKNKGKRCEKCWKLRLEESFKYANKNGFEMVSTTLLSSHYQSKNEIEKIGKKLEEEYKIKFWIPKKIERDLKTSGFYKQNYCGCGYSLVEDWEKKFSNI